MHRLITALFVILISANWYQVIAGTQAQRLSIAVIPMGTIDEYWKSIHAGAHRAARELNVDIIWKGPLKRDDRNAQVEIVENMITRRVAGIVLAPLDATALGAPVRDAVANKIPVVIIDSNLKGNDYVSFVATDNYKGGVLAANYLAQLLQKKGRVAMLRNVEGTASTGLREQGFLDAIKKYPNIKIVSANQHGGATTEETYKASENLLTSLRSSAGKINLDGMFCSCGPTTFGMLRALQDIGLEGKIRFVGFDSLPKLPQALKKGHLDALILQDPMMMSYLAVKTLVAYIQGKKVRPRIDTGVTVVTPDNMHNPKIRELLTPNLAKWLN